MSEDGAPACRSDDLFFLKIRRPPRSTLFPNTTLCRSVQQAIRQKSAVVDMPADALELAWGYPERKKITFEESDRKSTRLNSSHANISDAVFCLTKSDRHSEQGPHRERAPVRVAVEHLY